MSARAVLLAALLVLLPAGGGAASRVVASPGVPAMQSGHTYSIGSGSVISAPFDSTNAEVLYVNRTGDVTVGAGGWNDIATLNSHTFENSPSGHVRVGSGSVRVVANASSYGYAHGTLIVQPSRFLHVGAWVWINRKMGFRRTSMWALDRSAMANQCNPIKMDIDMVSGAPSDSSKAAYGAKDDAGTIIASAFVNVVRQREWHRYDAFYEGTSTGSTAFFFDGVYMVGAAGNFDTTGVDSIKIGMDAAAFFYSDTGSVWFDGIVVDTIPFAGWSVGWGDGVRPVGAW